MVHRALKAPGAFPPLSPKVPCPVRSSRAPRLLRRTLAALGLAALGASLGCAAILNNNPELRWKLFAMFGAPLICPEMLKRSVSLRLQDRAPGIGRFFPAQCSYAVDHNRQTIAVSMAGTGYGYMQPAQRVGFALSVSVEYRPDFMVAGDDLYLWSKLNRIIDGPRFQLGYLENKLVDVASNIPGVGSIANSLGNLVVTSAMTQGFTVIHNEDRGDDFSLGLLRPPSRPNHPFQVTNNERYTFANETVELAPNTRDFLGPFELPGGDQALAFSVSVLGPPIDVIIVDKLVGDRWRDEYQRGLPLGPPPGPIVAGGPLQPGPVDNRRYALPAGTYYVVLDNTPYAGFVAPAAGPWGGPTARVSYVAQLSK